MFGIPAVIAGSWFAVQRRRPGVVAALYGLTFLFGTVGFAGFWVGAMGI